MMKYSEIKLDDDEKTLLKEFKADGYKTIGKDFVFGLILSNDSKTVSLYVLKGFDWIETNSYYEIDKLLNPPKEPKTVWDLKDGDDYYWLTLVGSVYKDTWNSCYLDVGRRNQGNVFLTKEEAEFEAKRREVVTKVRKYAKPFKKGERNVYPSYDYDDDVIYFHFNNYCKSTMDYFYSTEDIKKAIDEVGEDDFKKYYLGVTE